MADTNPTDKPARILILCHPLTGHLNPVTRIAADLVRRGWSVTFLGPTSHKPRIAGSGAAFLPLQGDADLDDLLYYNPDNPNPPTPDYHTKEWNERAITDILQQCMEPIPAQWAGFKDALAQLHAATPAKPVVVLCEGLFHGILPLFFGAPLPDGLPAPPSICLSVTPPMLRSVDLPPFGLPLPFDPSDKGRALHETCWQHWAELTAPLNKLFHGKLAAAGATRFPPGPFLEGVNYTAHARILQIGVPGFEYPRSDFPPHYRFAGFIPPASAPPGGFSGLPPWWDEVVAAAAAGDKSIVVVAQGTVETNPKLLIVPTIEAMRGREDVLVVAILGLKGATLPDGFDVPANVRVADYLHYDAILPYARVWVHNGGYGAITHGVAHGVPMVVAGSGQDKPENIRRVRYSKIGVGLGSAEPSVEDMRISLDDVFTQNSYLERVQALRQQTIELDCFGTVEKAILEVVK